MIKLSLAARLIGTLWIGAIVSTSANAADIKLLSSNVLKAALAELLPGFERTLGHTVTVDYGVAGQLALKKIDSADAAIVSAAQIVDLQKRGKIAEGSRTNIAKVGIGVAVRKGAPKPDVSTIDALRRALLAAKTVGYVDPARGSPTGRHVESVFERLGVTAAVKPKIRLSPPGDTVFDRISKGEVEIQFGQISEIVATPAIELAGPLPPELQNFTLYAAGISTGSKQPALGDAIIRFLTTPAAAAVIRTKGLEPG